ncbi:MAG TPA: cupin domain-containing protein [Chloroflexota bacterium]|nr:cupin domain-containing protein [Chloroflexota bacterium]
MAAPGSESGDRLLGRPRENQAYALKPQQGWTYRNGIDFTVKAGEYRTTNGAAFIEYTTRKGEEPGEHVHPTEDEMFYVLTGALTFMCGDQTFDAEAGGFVFLPRGIPHDYTIRSDGPVRLLVITAPPREPGDGWDGFVAGFEMDGDIVSQPGDV